MQAEDAICFATKKKRQMREEALYQRDNDKRKIDRIKQFTRRSVIRHKLKPADIWIRMVWEESREQQAV